MSTIYLLMSGDEFDQNDVIGALSELDDASRWLAIQLLAEDRPLMVQPVTLDDPAVLETIRTQAPLWLVGIDLGSTLRWAYPVDDTTAEGRLLDAATGIVSVVVRAGSRTDAIERAHAQLAGDLS